MSPFTFYGDIGLDRIDIRHVAAWSIDLRRFTGMRDAPDESRPCPPGTFSVTVVTPLDSEPAFIGELRVWLDGREAHIVGAPTQRTGIYEITIDMLTAAESDAAYRQRLREWLGIA